MSFPVIKAAGYSLAYAPDMILRNGSTAHGDLISNPESDYITKGHEHIRSYEDYVNYLPNQVYIGNVHPQELKNYSQPYYNEDYKDGKEEGKFGAIKPEDELIALMKLVDMFDLVVLCEEFVDEVKDKMIERYSTLNIDIEKKLKGADISSAEERIEKGTALGMYHQGELVGYVRAAHATDKNLAADVMFENLACKATGVTAGMQLLEKFDIDPMSIDYVIECSEEAAGDINQRGGGNIAKAIAENLGLGNASGSDTISFCAAPAHSIIEAASFVKAGTFDNVLVVAGGSTAKLGMNGKEHIKAGAPILEDGIAGFATLISKNDGVSPVLRTDIVGKHTVDTGSSPQAVTGSLTSKALDKDNLKFTDVDVFALELQNPDITKTAGAGDVPEANYKMIGALGVMEGQIEREEMPAFVESQMPGWAPTQGHIPSGAPYCGFAIHDMTEGDLDRALLVGKGSLFLGRLTNLFDGVSILIERNTGEVEDESAGSTDAIKAVLADAIRSLAETMTEED